MLLLSPPVHPYLREVRFSEAEVAAFPRLDRCPACGSTTRATPLVQLGDASWRARVDLLQCADCEHLYYANPPPAEYFTRYYKQVWNAAQGESLRKPAALKPKVSRKLVSLANEMGKTDRAMAVLEIGCGLGGMLIGLAEAGYANLYGTEASDYRAAVSAKRFPGRVFAGGYQSVPDGLDFDLIFSNHVVEHIYAPREALRWMTARLRPGGVIVIIVPESSGEPVLNQALFLPHLHSFSHRSLAAMGKSCGLDCVYWKGANAPYETAAVFFRPSERPALARDRFDTPDTIRAPARPQAERFRALLQPAGAAGSIHFVLPLDESEKVRMAGEAAPRRIGFLARLAGRLALPLARAVSRAGWRKLGTKTIGRIRYVSGRFVGRSDGPPLIGGRDRSAVFHMK